MHTAQSMHSSGSITSMFGPSLKQSTGQTSTQSVYLHLMHDSVTTWVMEAAGRGVEKREFYAGGAPAGKPAMRPIGHMHMRFPFPRRRLPRLGAFAKVPRCP